MELHKYKCMKSHEFANTIKDVHYSKNNVLINIDFNASIKHC